MLTVAAGAAPAADRLDMPLTATWSGIGLREWADRVAAAVGLPVVVDRRLDPDTRVSLDCRAEPLRGVLGRGAAAAGGDVAVLASTARIVPAGTAATIVAAESARVAAIRGLPPRQRAVLDERRPWTWPAAARPRDLIADRAAAGGVRLAGLDSLPHDHLPAASLPAISLAEGLDLVLAHYDLRVDWRTGPGAAATGRVIWVEMGSINPVVVLPGALAERGEEIAEQLTASVTGSGASRRRTPETHVTTGPDSVCNAAASAGEPVI
jgi:hypothetical protein